MSVGDPECARGGGVSHILAEKRGVSFTLIKKMHENAIFSLRGSVRRVRMLDPPLHVAMWRSLAHLCHVTEWHSSIGPSLPRSRSRPTS